MPEDAPQHAAGTPDAQRRWPIVAREGWPIVAAFALGSGLLVALSVWLLGQVGWGAVAVGAPLTVWCVWFFRDPDRRTPATPGAVISPADGVVCAVGPAPFPPELGLTESETAGGLRVCVFMNVFDVHVNRAPAAGRVERIRYTPGRFFNASFDKASEHNERSAMALRLPDGRVLAVVQIAGLVARRIICRVREGRRLDAGERYGLIRFGSRVDTYLPAGSSVSVRVGQRVRAGESIIGSLATAPARSTAVERAGVGAEA